MIEAPPLLRRRLPSLRLATPGIATALILLSGGCGKAPPPAVPPVDVTFAPVEQRDVPVTQEWVASLHGFVDAQIRAQVNGYLMKQDYREGASVHRGDLLFEIDPRPFRAALAQAEGQVAQAQAQLGKTEQDVKRYGPLAKEQAISEQELDDAVQANLAGKASLASATAAVDTAKLNLEFTRIVSPVDGIAGLINVQVGDLVGPGAGVLTTVSALDPMKAYFPISEQSYLDFRREHPEADGFPTDIALTLVLSDGSVYPSPGKVYAADREIDPSTGALQIAAVFPNPRNLLRPGQYGRIRAVVRTVKGALLVPTRAISELQGGYELAILDPTNHAHLQAVTIGAQLGSLTVITNGLKPSDRVVVDGLQKLREGMVVNPQPYKAE